MAFFDSSHQRAAILLALLGVGLAIALAPYATGLIGAPVLYVILSPLHRRLMTRFRPGTAAGIVILFATLVMVLPALSLIGVLVGEAQAMAVKVVQSPIFGRIAELKIGTYEVGPELVALGKEVISWLGGSALQLLGTATRMVLNLLFAFFGLYYLLLNHESAWATLQPYIPFSDENTAVLRERFRAVTTSTVIGTGLTALAQGAIVAVGFGATGLSNALFWGVVTVVFAILPVVGSGMVWLPGVVLLLFESRVGAGVGLAIWCIIGSVAVDYVLRPLVFNRYAQIHPLITLVGAVAGVSYFGLLGLLVGPLALSYFFEIVRMYRQEYLPPGSKSGLTEEIPTTGPVVR
jgi:predicted PurR-regulated permease PerM